MQSAGPREQRRRRHKQCFRNASFGNHARLRWFLRSGVIIGLTAGKEEEANRSRSQNKSHGSSSYSGETSGLVEELGSRILRKSESTWIVAAMDGNSRPFGWSEPPLLNSSNRFASSPGLSDLNTCDIHRGAIRGDFGARSVTPSILWARASEVYSGSTLCTRVGEYFWRGLRRFGSLSQTTAIQAKNSRQHLHS